PVLPSLTKPAPGVNLVPNPGFEDDPPAAGWEAASATGDETGKATWSQGEAHTGQRSLKMESVTKTREWRSRVIAIDPAAAYRLSAWLRAKDLEGRSDVYLECLGRWLRPVGRAGYDGGVFAFENFGWGERYAIIRPDQFPRGTSYARIVCQTTGTVHAKGEAWFDDLRLAMEPCTMTLKPLRDKDAPAEAVFQPREGVRYELAAHVPGYAQKPLTARVAVRDYFGKEHRRQEQRFTCDARDDAQLTLDVGRLDALGYFDLQAEVVDGEKSMGRESASFGVTPFDLAAWKPDERSAFGICHLRDDRMFRLAQIAGIKWHRSNPNPHWSGVEPKQGEWTWAGFDRVWQAEQPFGIHRLIILSSIPLWASTDPDEFFTFFRRPANKRFMRLPKNLADFENYVFQTVSRYKDRLKYWEIWNEADIDFWHGTDEEYIQLMQAAYRGAKRADKECIVSMTGLAYPFAHKGRSGRLMDGRAFLEKCLKLAPNEFDLINWHSYGGVKPLERKLRETNELKRQYNCAKPVWITETGAPTHLKGVTEQEQARYAPQAYALSLAAGVDKIFWHCFHSWGQDPNYNEHHFGLVRYDCSPKPSFMAYAAMTRKLDGAKAAGEVTVGPGVRALAFERAGQPITVLWSETERLTTLLKLDRETATLTDMMGNPKPLSAAMKLARLELTPDAVYLEGARIVSAGGQVVTLESGVTLTPGESRAATLTMRNPLDAQAQGECKLVCPEGWQASPSSVRFDLAVGASQSASITFTAPKR
ncbi:MAG: hypothetical protein FJ272_13145, partial [Planctomycetes bacterium]|nr:hypothetical protein [Planctomycetota bacterium]